MARLFLMDEAQRSDSSNRRTMVAAAKVFLRAAVAPGGVALTVLRPPRPRKLADAVVMQAPTADREGVSTGGPSVASAAAEVAPALRSRGERLEVAESVEAPATSAGEAVPEDAPRLALGAVVAGQKSEPGARAGFPPELVVAPPPADVKAARARLVLPSPAGAAPASLARSPRRIVRGHLRMAPAAGAVRSSPARMPRRHPATRSHAPP